MKPISYRPDIDGLRALAVAMVVGYHAELLGLTGGFVGVDVFFVISGYLITQHLVAEIENKGKLAFLDFYARRVRRLFPALLTTVLGVLLIWTLFFLGDPQETHRFIKSIRFALFGMANFFFSNNTGGYFDGQASEMPLLHFWSLAVEEQFYLVWPLLLSFFFRTGLLWFSALSFVGALFLIHQSHAQIAFYWMPAHAWELGMGALLVFTRFQQGLQNRFLNGALALIGLILILVPAFIFSHATSFPGLGALPPVLGTFLILLAGSSKESNPINQFLGCKPLVSIGLLSYGWYLWHWPGLALARIYEMGALPPLPVRIGIVIISLIFAWISLRWIEKPIRFGFKNWKSRSVLMVAAGCGIVLSLAAMLIMEGEKKIIGQGRKDFLSKIEARMSLTGSCIDRSESAFTDRCAIRNPDAKNTVLMWGDSHSFAFFPMLEDYAKTHPLELVLEEHSAVLPLLAPVALDSKAQSDAALKFNQDVIKDVEKWVNLKGQKHVSVVIAARWMQRSGKTPISVADDLLHLSAGKTIDEDLKMLSSGLHETLKSLTALGIPKILVVLPYPEFKFMALRCHLRNSDHCDTPRSVMDTYRKETVQAIRDLSAGFKNVELADPVEQLCSQEVCPQVIRENGTEIPLTFDDDHPSVSGSELFGKKIRSQLDWLTRED